MEPCVSVLIPTYNRSALLKHAIDSALSQTYSCEVIVCDHGSSDDTRSLCLSYGSQIKYIRLDKDYGIHFAELHSLLESSCEFVHFCFDDDRMHPQYIEQSMQLMSENVGIVFTEYQLINLESPGLCDPFVQPFDQINKCLAYSFRLIHKPFLGLISPSSALVRREDAIRCMYMNTNLCSDHYYFGVGPDWLITAYPLVKYRYCGYIKTPMVAFGVHSDSITIDATGNDDYVKRKRFFLAYCGARAYLLSSYVVSLMKLDLFIGVMIKVCLYAINLPMKLRRALNFICSRDV